MGAVSPHPRTEIKIDGSIEEHRRIGAFFFMARPEPRSLVELAALARVEKPYLDKLADEPGAEVVIGSWAGIPATSRLREYDEHVCLEVYFSNSGFFKLDRFAQRPAELPVEQDPARHIAFAFRDACLRLGPDVGLFTISATIAGTEVMGQEVYPLVKRWDAYGLAQDATLLYVTEDMKYNLTAMPGIDERDSLPVERGRLVFAGSGGRRWSG